MRFPTLLWLVIGCGAATEPGSIDAGGVSCTGAPTCTLELGSCCDDVGFSASCVDGAWVCDPCDVPSFEFACGRRDARLTGTCTRWAREAGRLGISVAEYCDRE